MNLLMEGATQKHSVTAYLVLLSELQVKFELFWVRLNYCVFSEDPEDILTLENIV